jgi:hypothetical protein
LLIRRVPTKANGWHVSDHSVSETALSVVGFIHTAQHAVVKCVANDSCPAFLCLDTWQVSDWWQLTKPGPQYLVPQCFCQNLLYS